MVECAPKGVDFQAIPSHLLITVPKLQVHFQLVKLENGIIQRKLARRSFFPDLDQVADAWTDQVHPLAAWTRADNQS